MGRILNQNKVDRDELLEIINDLDSITVIDNLESNKTGAALSANMGRYLDLTKPPRVHTSPTGATFGQATVSLFGHTRATEVDPLMDGSTFIGTDDGRYARGDHRHPTDITRAPIHWPDVEHDQYQLTGEPRAVTPPDDSNDNRIVTTEWVHRVSGGVVYGTSSSSGTNPSKRATLYSTFMSEPVFFLRKIGSAVGITFRNADNSGHSLENITTLNVQDTGAAEILFGGKYLTNGMLGKDYTHLFVFDNKGYWRLINPVPGTGLTGTIKPELDFWPDEGNEDEDNLPTPINRMSGYFGFTTKGDGIIDEDGQVDRVYINISFDPKPSDVEVVVTSGSNYYACSFGDGRQITAFNPVVLHNTSSSALIQFEIEEYYPSNSPCQLVYTNSFAEIIIREV
jgi:hypothetical protein